MQTTFRKKLENIVTNDKLGDAIDMAMSEIENEDKDIYNNLVLLKSRFTANENSMQRGTATNENYLMTNNKIKYALQQTSFLIYSSCSQDTVILFTSGRNSAYAGMNIKFR